MNSFDTLVQPEQLTNCFELQSLSGHADITSNEDLIESGLQCTYNLLPVTKNTLENVKVPLGIIIKPLHISLEGIECDTIIRCSSCQAYLNPFVSWRTSCWVCNLCFRLNSLPSNYQPGPELQYNCIEYIASPEYSVRPPQPLIHLFLLDVSLCACQVNYLKTVFQVLDEDIDKLQADARAQIGFILFDSYVHFFYVLDHLMKELVVGDVEDLFLPAPSNLLFNITEAKSLLPYLYSAIITRYSKSTDSNSALGAALQAGYKLLGPTGGRVCVFAVSLPNYGPGKLEENPKLTCNSDFYKSMSLDFCSKQIAVDVFMLNTIHANLATLKDVSMFSSGSFYHIPFLSVDGSCHEKLRRTLQKHLSNLMGVEAVCRLRLDHGLEINKFHGSCFMRTPNMISLPSVTSDKSYGVELSISGTLKEKIYLQTAVLFTTVRGERRIRVHTLGLHSSSDEKLILSRINANCVFSLLTKITCDKLLLYTAKDVTQSLVMWLADIVRHFNNHPHYGVFLPPSLSLLPMLIFDLVNSPLFEINPDHRAAFLFHCKALSSRELLNHLQPNWYRMDQPNKEPYFNWLRQIQTALE